MPKPLTPSERLVGRRLPPLPTHLDALMAGFVKAEGGFHGRAEPSENWLRPAHRKARKAGWIRLGMRMSLMGGRSFGIWHLTPAGETEALAALDRVRARHEARETWSREFLAIHRAARGAAKDTSETREETTPCDPM